VAAGFEFQLEPVDVPPVSTKYRKIQGQLPVPESLEILQMLDRYESRSMHGQMPLVWDRAQGVQVYDAWGNMWLDFTSTIFVANAGHGNPRIREALRAVLEKPLFHSYTYATRERAEFLKFLVENSPDQFEKAYMLSAGTEAVEACLKLMRMHGKQEGKRKGVILTFEGNWHGRTLGAQMLSHNPAQKDWVGYHDPQIHHLPFPYPWSREAQADPALFFQRGLDELCRRKELDPDKDICGVLLETFQGWGALFYPEEFVKEVERFCRESGVLMAFDEMQAGFGRTGSLYGYQHYGVKPDILCLGKGASSSMPLSIVLSSKKILDLPEVGSMSSTHSANPWVCAAGKANLEELLEGGLIENSRVLGEVFQQRLGVIQEEFSQQIGLVTGKGLLAALHFRDSGGNPLSEAASKVCELAMQKGLLLVHTGRESIKLAPPLCIEREALEEGIEVLHESIREILG
jgi:4-aminobutyrate aminotransferase / (S)-3-amino-2-methylpropionate transaminase / 5-aminovalerate transaminase